MSLVETFERNEGRPANREGWRLMTWITTPWIGRRTIVAGMASVAAASLIPGQSLRAQEKRLVTPRQTEGPYYPVSWTGDIDHDLVIVQGEAARALGQVAHVEGRVLDLAGQPIKDAVVEIWQCDAKGVYRHPRDERGTRRVDQGFQGRGRAMTDAAGRYAFRTIKPVAYPGRTPHIHFKVARAGGAALVTQLYVFGEAQNASDGVLNGIRDSRQRDSVIARFDPADGIEPGAVAARFDLVLG
jgi:protocatechuate 3,4-dioxygenase, beta subunit